VTKEDSSSIVRPRFDHKEDSGPLRPIAPGGYSRKANLALQSLANKKNLSEERRRKVDIYSTYRGD